jgi:hypothetical protein
MLRTVSDIEGYSIRASDGDIGQVSDFLFDDPSWVIRYLVVETGFWLTRRKVLISPLAIGAARWDERLLPVAITKEQVRNSPDIDTERPVSRQHEAQYLDYYGYPYYWAGSGLWGMGADPRAMPAAGAMPPPAAGLEFARQEDARHDNDDPQLRSGREVRHYHVHAQDGEIGRVQGMLIDDSNWAIRYLIVHTSRWWQGQRVLVSPAWIENVRWDDSSITVALTRKAVRRSPPYMLSTQLGRIEEEALHGHYGKRGYWVDDLLGEAEERIADAPVT